MQARVLPAVEWDKLRPLYDQNGVPLPRPTEAVIYVVEDDQRNIVGSWPIHSILVGGLMHVDKDHRGNGVADLLAKAVDASMNPGDSLFTAVGPHTEQLAIENGMVPIEGKLYRKDF